MKTLKKILSAVICTAMTISLCSCNRTQPSPAPSPTEDNSLPENTSFSVIFFDMGYGDAALVECDGKYMLIDGGSKADSQKMYSILKEKNIPHLDYVVATGTADEHIGGLAGALNYATADTTFCCTDSHNSEAFMDFKKYADKNGGGITVPNAGNRYPLGSAEAEFIWVNKSSTSGALAIKITYGETALLIAGDIDAAAEKLLLDSNAVLKADVLKIADHGSDNATTSAFLRSVGPQYAVISANGTSRYPGEEALSLLEIASVTLYRTDLNGDITCTSDGKTVTFTAEKQAKTEDLFKYNISGESEKQQTKTESQPQQTEPEKTPDVKATPEPTAAPTIRPTAKPTVNIFADELYEANLITNLISAYGSVKTIDHYMHTTFINSYFDVGGKPANLRVSMDMSGHYAYNGWYNGYNFYDNGTRVVQQAFIEQLDGDKIVPGQQDIASYFMYEEDVEYIGRDGEDYLFEVTSYSTPYSLTVDGMSLAVKKIQWPLDPGSDKIEYIYGEWVEGQDILNCWTDGSPMRMVNVYVDIFENGEHKTLYRPFYLPATWELSVDSMTYRIYTYMDSNYTQPYSYPGDYTNYDLYVTNSVG